MVTLYILVRVSINMNERCFEIPGAEVCTSIRSPVEIAGEKSASWAYLRTVQLWPSTAMPQLDWLQCTPRVFIKADFNNQTILFRERKMIERADQ